MNSKKNDQLFLRQKTTFAFIVIRVVQQKRHNLLLSFLKASLSNFKSKILSILLSREQECADKACILGGRYKMTGSIILVL